MTGDSFADKKFIEIKGRKMVYIEAEKGSGADSRCESAPDPFSAREVPP